MNSNELSTPPWIIINYKPQRLKASTVTVEHHGFLGIRPEPPWAAVYLASAAPSDCTAAAEWPWSKLCGACSDQRWTETQWSSWMNYYYLWSWIDCCSSYDLWSPGTLNMFLWSKTKASSLCCFSPAVASLSTASTVWVVHVHQSQQRVSRKKIHCRWAKKKLNPLTTVMSDISGHSLIIINDLLAIGEWFLINNG